MRRRPSHCIGPRPAAQARQNLRAGQPAFEVHAFPFRLTDAALAAYKANPWHDFWQELKPGYDAFEKTRVPPVIEVRGGRYVAR